MPHIRTGFSLVIFALLSANIAFAQPQNAPGPLPLSPSQEFRFISTSKTTTFEKELNDWARQGFRFARLAKALDDHRIGGLLAREKEGEGGKYEYRVLATYKLSTMRKELEAAAAEGFELRGITIKRKFKVFFDSQETIVVIERPAGETKRRFEYKFVSTTSENTGQKELDAAVSEGYFPKDMVMDEDTKLLFVADRIKIVLARDANNPDAEMGAREYRLLQTDKVSTMEKEMNQLAKEGFQFHLTSIGSITIMTRPLKEKTQKYEYKLLATQRTGAMQKELTEMGLQGYRFLGASTRSGDLISFGAGGLVSVMERGVGEVSRRQYEYKLLATTRESTTQKELSEALARGYKFIEISSFGATSTMERLIVLGRIKEATAEAK
jgi:hypothetical protein